MRDFQTRSYPDLIARHHRPVATASGALRGRARHGRCAYIAHFGLGWVLLRGVKVGLRMQPAGDLRPGLRLRLPAGGGQAGAASRGPRVPPLRQARAARPHAGGAAGSGVAMCGIAGVGGSDPRRVPLEPGALAAMTAAIEHRGPDEDGHLLEPGVALGMRRLSVIDPAGQPAADRQRGRRGDRGLQRRDLQLPRAARGARGRGHRFRHRRRRRDDRPSLRGAGAAFRRAPARHVRDRGLGPRAGAGSSSPATGWA